MYPWKEVLLPSPPTPKVSALFELIAGIEVASASVEYAPSEDRRRPVPEADEATMKCYSSSFRLEYKDAVTFPMENSKPLIFDHFNSYGPTAKIAMPSRIFEDVLNQKESVKSFETSI